jgi:hypothetical protein
MYIKATIRTLQIRALLTARSKGEFQLASIADEHLALKE